MTALSPAARRVLAALPADRPRTLRWLAHAVALSNDAATEAAADLVRQGLVEQLGEPAGGHLHLFTRLRRRCVGGHVVCATRSSA